MASSEEYDGRSQSTRATPSFRRTRLGGVRKRRSRVGPRQTIRNVTVQGRRTRHLEDPAGPRAHRRVVRKKIRTQRGLDKVGAALVGFVEQRRDARLDQISLAFQRGDVAGVEPEAPRAIRHRPLAGRAGNGRGQLGQLRLELRQGKRGRIRMARAHRRACTAAFPTHDGGRRSRSRPAAADSAAPAASARRWPPARSRRRSDARRAARRAHAASAARRCSRRSAPGGRAGPTGCRLRCRCRRAGLASSPVLIRIAERDVPA